MIKAITSKDNPIIKFALSLKDNKNRKVHKKFLAETFKALDMAIKNGQVDSVFTLEWIDLPEDINQYLVSEDLLKKLSSNVHPEGVVFIANMLEPKDEEFKKILYLDEINDPGNLGTLIRTALAFSYDAVVVSENSCSIYNEKVINSSKGAIFAIPVFNGDIKKYKGSHQIISSCLAKDSISLDDFVPSDKFVLILGNESHGIRKELLSLSDVKVIIPISNIDSLNVAVAGGILMNKIR